MINSIRRFALLSAFLLSAIIGIAKYNAFGEEITNYIWPLSGSKEITSVMGEARANHPHGGIDISLFGKVGVVPIVSVGDGKLIRFRVSRVGYGKCLYIQMDDGSIAVYAHLDRFNERFEEMARNLQLASGHYQIDQLDQEGGPRVKKGEIIGYGGKSGTKSPHLHFEIRDKDNICRNPLTNGFPISDDIRPSIKAVMFAPLWPGGTVNGSASIHTFQFLYRNGKPGLASPVEISGRVGLSLLATDRVKPKGREFLPYRIVLKEGENDLFEYRADSVDFADKRVYLAQFDMVHRGAFRGTFLRLYNPYPCRLPFFPMNNQGFLDSLSEGKHNLEVQVFDANENSITANLPIAVHNPAGYIKQEGPAFEAAQMPYTLADGGSFITPDGKFSMKAQEHGLFAPMTFSFQIESASDTAELHVAGQCVRVSSQGPPLRKDVEVSMSYAKGESKPESLGLYLFHDGRPEFLGNEIDRQKNIIVGHTEEMGLFCLARDLTPPDILRVMPADHAKIKSIHPKISFLAADSGSGVTYEDVTAQIDDRLIIIDFSHGKCTGAPHWNLNPGIHTLTIRARDRAHNETITKTTWSVSRKGEN